MNDLNSAQSAYDMALDEYNKLLSSSSRPQGGAMALTDNPNQGGRYLGFGQYVDIGGGGQIDPNALNGSRSALDAARKALQGAKAGQQNKLNGQFDRLTGQARDALYQGLTPYNPQPLLSNSGTSFAAPTGGLASGGQRIQSLIGGR